MTAGGWRGPRLEEALPELGEEIRAARAQVSGAPLWVVIPLAVGLLVAGALLCGGIAAFVLPGLDAGAAAVLGGGVLLASIAASWMPLPALARPFVLVTAVVGRGLLWIALVDVSRDLWSFAALELVLAVVHRDPLQRACAALAAPLLFAFQHWRLFGGAHDLSAQAQLVFVPTLAFGLVVSSARRAWAGVPWVGEWAGAVGPAALVAALWLPSYQGTPWFDGLTLALAAGCAGVALVVTSGLGLAWTDRLAVCGGLLALGATTWAVPGFTVAVLVAGIGFLTRSPAVWATAVAAMVGYGVWFYYRLELPLYEKGGAMIALGLVLAAAGWWAGRRGGRVAGPGPDGAGRPDRAGWVLASVGALLAIALPVGLSARQELRIRTAETVYVPLAPRDPRSLVQGDYLRLRYDVLPTTLTAASGVAVVYRDERGIVSFVREDDGAELEPDERRLRWWQEHGRPTAVSTAWLFEEGTGSSYRSARYGIVALTLGGDAVLTGLADEELARLGPPRRLW